MRGSWRQQGREGGPATVLTCSLALVAVRAKRLARSLFLAAACLMLPAASIAEERPGHAHLDILVLHSYHQGLPWTDSEEEGLQLGLAEHLPRLGVFIEYLDALRFPLRGADAEAAVAQRLAERYARIQIEYLVATDDPAYRPFLAYRDRLWPGLPILFAGVNNAEDRDVAHLERVAALSELPDFFANLALIQSLHPKLDRLVVVGDETRTFASNRKALEDANATLSPPFTVDAVVLHSLRDGNDNNSRALAGEIVEEYIRFTVGNEERYLHNIIAPIKYGDAIRGILGINIDITERKRSEELLELMRLSVEYGSDAIFSINRTRSDDRRPTVSPPSMQACRWSIDAYLQQPVLIESTSTLQGDHHV